MPSFKIIAGKRAATDRRHAQQPEHVFGQVQTDNLFGSRASA